MTQHPDNHHTIFGIKTRKLIKTLTITTFISILLNLFLLFILQYPSLRFNGIGNLIVNVFIFSNVSLCLLFVTIVYFYIGLIIKRCNQRNYYIQYEIP